MEFEKLQDIIVDVLNVQKEEVKPETTFVDDLGADSLDIFQIIMGIEEEFDIEILSCIELSLQYILLNLWDYQIECVDLIGPFVFLVVSDCFDIDIAALEIMNMFQVFSNIFEYELDHVNIPMKLIKISYWIQILKRKAMEPNSLVPC